MTEILSPEQSQLGKRTPYSPHYNPDFLFAISRKNKRDELGINDALPFFGFDFWNHYEVSWLNLKGKPIVAIAEISYDCRTPYLIESKSMKLYFNSFNNTHFKNEEAVATIIKKDLSARIGGDVTVKITTLKPALDDNRLCDFSGECLDDLDIECTSYYVDACILQTSPNQVEETLFSNLLKSNCLVTNQPDWGSIQISYRGRQINRESLLRYIVSFRNHNEFHEQCIERIFVDIMTHCHPEELTVYGRYTRRGGLDINPYRTTKEKFPDAINCRLIRQ